MSIATLTGADIDGEPTIVGSQLRRDRFNRAVPRYRSEANNWQIVPAAPVAVAEFATQDGSVRTKELEWPLVQNVDQASQLAAYGICNSREIGPIDLPLIPPWMGLEPGDCFTLDEPEFGLTNQKLVIVQRSRDLSTAERSVTCVTETDSKHPFCLGQTGTPPPLPSLSAVDTLPTPPDPGSWTVTDGHLTGPGGTLPAIIITGAVDDPNAIAIIVEYREVISPGVYGPWIGTEYPKTATRIEIGGVKAGATYQTRIRYRYARNVEDPDTNTTIGQVIVGGVDAGTVGGITPAQIGHIQADATQALADLAAEIARAQTTEGALNLSLVNMGVTVAGNTASISANYTALQTVDTSLAASISSIQTSVGANSVAITNESAARISDVGSLAGSISNLYAATGALSAQATSQGLAIVDAATKIASGRFILSTAATGGKPNRFTLYSDSLGTSFMALEAAQIFFGDNTVFDDATDTLRTVTGTTARVIAWGAAFGAAADLLEWVGDSSIALGAMSKANAIYFTSMSAPYFGGSSVPINYAQSSASTFSNGGSSSSTWVTQTSITFPGRPAGGFWTLGGRLTSGRVSGGTAAFRGGWRILESRSNAVLASGSFTVPNGGAGLSLIDDFDTEALAGLIPQQATAGDITLSFQVQQTSGSVTLSSLTGGLSATYSPGAV